MYIVYLADSDTKVVNFKQTQPFLLKKSPFGGQNCISQIPFHDPIPSLYLRNRRFTRRIRKAE